MTILPQKPALVAVGSAHLFGEQGLILRLRQIGYKVEPILLNSKQKEVKSVAVN